MTTTTRPDGLRHIFALLGIALLCLLTWAVLQADRQTAASVQSQQASNALLDRLSADLNARHAALRRMADRWEAQGGITDAQFKLNAMSYLRDMPGFRALSFTDAGHTIRNVLPDRDGSAVGRNVASFDPSRARILAEVKRTGKTIMTPAISLIDGSGAGTLIIVPVFKDGAFSGSLIAVINFDQWMNQILGMPGQRPNPGAQAVQLTLDGKPVFQTGSWARATPDHARTTQEQGVFGRTLGVGIAQAPIDGGQWTQLPLIIAFSVGMLAALLYLMQWLYQHAKSMGNIAKLANLSLSDRNARLKTEISERRQAENQAIRATELKSRFLANMSHEIRTPINAIMGMFELIQASDIPERQRRQAGVGRDAAQRLFEQLTNVLDLSQLEAKTLSFTPTRIVLRDVAKEWVVMLDALVVKSQKPLTTRCKIAEDVPEFVLLDQARVAQIVTNLLDNAVKYTVSGTISLDVRPARRSDEPETGLVIAITDSGCGIPEAERLQVFDRFSRGQGENVRERLGAGLGLSIVQELADLMGLQLLLDEPAGGGCRFRVIFPQSVVISPPAGASSAATPSHGARSKADPADTNADPDTAGRGTGVDHIPSPA